MEQRREKIVGISGLGELKHNIEVLQAWADDPKCSFGKLRVIGEGKKQVIIETQTQKRRYLHHFCRPNPHEFHHLKDVMKQLQENIRSLANESERDAARNDLKNVYEAIKKKFLEEQQKSTFSGRLRASDLLEAQVTGAVYGIDRIKGEELQKKATLIERALAFVKRLLSFLWGKQILLARYQKLNAIIDEMQAKKELTRADIENLLKKHLLEIEEVPSSKMIDLMYAHRFAGREQLNRVVTALAGWKYGSSKAISSVKKTLSFFKKFHIDPWLEIGNEMYSFSEIFGKQLRDKMTYQQAFIRSFVDRAKEIILASFYARREKIRQVLRDESAQTICANAYSRVTVIPVARGEVGKPFRIRGKVLEVNPKNIQKAKSEKSYAKRFLFTIQQMLGGNTKASLVAPRSSDQAKRALLGRITDMVNQHDMYMVVQRLSPADPHIFYTTADGKVLSLKHCCDELGAEASQLRELLPEDKVTIDISGRVSSVNTKALRKDSSILAENDRKVMMVKHVDGSLAIHVFIGATSVNLVDVSASAGNFNAGSPVGSMKFGGQSKKDWVQQQSFLRKMVERVKRWGKSFLKRATPEQIETVQKERKMRVTKEGVEFPKEASTVISLYPARHYVPVPEIQKFSALSSGGETIEIQCHLGDTIAHPVSYETIQLMNSLAVSPSNRFEEAVKEFRCKLEASEKRSLFEEKWLTILRKASPLEGDDLYMMKKLEAAWSARLTL
jgi:phosphatidylserine decarboxylase